MKVKCRFCGKELNKEEAVRVPRGRTNVYYCPEHAGMMTPESKFYNELQSIFPFEVSRGIMVKEFKDIANQYGYEKMLSYLEANHDYLERILASKDFNNPFAACRYMLAILKNNLPAYKMPVPVKELTKVTDVSDYKQKYKKKTNKRSLNDIFSNLE